MRKYFETYQEAFKYAENLANEWQMELGLEKSGKGYIVRMIPQNPSKRFGVDLSCEVVHYQRRTE